MGLFLHTFIQRGRFHWRPRNCSRGANAARACECRSMLSVEDRIANWLFPMLFPSLENTAFGYRSNPVGRCLRELTTLRCSPRRVRRKLTQSAQRHKAKLLTVSCIEFLDAIVERRTLLDA